MEFDFAILVPSSLKNVTRSTPLSSHFIKFDRSPTVCCKGLRIKEHASRLDGSGTIIFGRPFSLCTETVSNDEETDVE
uniref:SJCHGC03567 protein n=1 Tax=Schistosoma japonicum TaxID=6182 RepID=Q5BSQ3_SCHJA|nr:SJCHGC03567 protein [Schistosoma japonicum]